MTTHLTEAHRLAQVALGAATVAQLRAIFRILDPEDLDGSFAAWLAVVVPVVQAARSRSSALAAAYMRALRSAAVDEDDFEPALAGPVDDEALRISMLVCGPVSLRSNLARAVPLARALDIAEARTAAAGMRHALDGGRETITTAVRSDRRARGWQRVTSGNACAFCTMLAGRGTVYSESSADFASHDGCACAAEPVFD